MSEHLYTHRKTSDLSASIPQHSPFQPRPFMVQPQTEEQSEQPDMKTALQRAERYGHRLDRIKFGAPPVQHSEPRSVQPKLTIGEPGDRYEQEADRVAASVVQQINAPASQQSTQSQSVQREAAPDEKDELMKKPDISPIQRKEEPEEGIQAKPEIAALQRQEEPEEEIQAKLSISDQKRSPLPTQVQREAMPEEEELQAKSTLQRREAIGGEEASTDVESAINSARGGGQPLEAGLQRSMGQAMGADFSGVKVHTDAQADRLNRSVQARAFTTGQDVFFRSGEYNPGSRGGQELLAHELTHVVQQNSGAVQRSPQPPDKEKDAKKVEVAKQISLTLRAMGLQVFLGGAAAATLVTETRQINDLDFRLDGLERIAFAGEQGDTLKKEIREALINKGLEVPQEFEKVGRKGFETTIKGEVNNVEVSITSEPSTDKTLSRGEAQTGLESIGGFDILLQKARSAAERVKGKSDSVATDVYDIIKVKKSLPGGGKGILNCLNSYWGKNDLAANLITRLEQLKSTGGRKNNPYSRGKDKLTGRKGIITTQEFDAGIDELIQELSNQRKVTVL